MKKKFLISFIIFFTMILPCNAQKLPVKIAPIQVISTHMNEVEVGDWINFEVVNDVYKEDNLFIKRGTTVIGIVDYVHENGWLSDAAEIKIVKFFTYDVNKNKIEFNYPLVLKSQLINSDVKEIISFCLTSLIRGAEIYIEPDSKIYNVFITD